MLKKLSLAALIAMGSMSVASATPLTEAIKGVDLSGMIRLRFYNESDNKADGSTKSGYTRWRTSSDFKFTIPVSEELKLVYKLGVEGNIYGVVGANSTVDPNPGENLVFFKYTNNGLNVLVGKIPVATPVTGSGHGEAHGAGVLGTYKVSDNLTVAAVGIDAIKATDNLPGKATAKNTYALAGIYTQDALAVQAWYFQVEDTIDSDIVVRADYKINNIALHADFATASLDDSIDSNTQSFINVSAKYTQDALCAKVGYAKTGKDGGVVALDSDSPLTAIAPVGQLYTFTDGLKHSLKDSTMLYGKLGYNVDAKTNVYAAFASVDDAKSKTTTDLTLGGSYKYTKKLRLSAYYSILSADNGNSLNKIDNNEFRAEAKYSF